MSYAPPDRESIAVNLLSRDVAVQRQNVWDLLLCLSRDRDSLIRVTICLTDSQSALSRHLDVIDQFARPDVERASNSQDHR